MMARYPLFRTAGLLSPRAAVDAQDNAEGLAKRLVNPIASWIRVPFQLKNDGDIGPRHQAERWTLNIHPAIPVFVNEDWTMLSRANLPLNEWKEFLDQRPVRSHWPRRASSTSTGPAASLIRSDHPHGALSVPMSKIGRNPEIRRFNISCAINNHSWRV